MIYLRMIYLMSEDAFDYYMDQYFTAFKPLAQHSRPRL